MIGIVRIVAVRRVTLNASIAVVTLAYQGAVWRGLTSEAQTKKSIADIGISAPSAKLILDGNRCS